MSFSFELVSPERVLFSGEVESVVIPAGEGEMTVLAHHAPLMTSLRPGVVTLARANGAAERHFVRGGFADISPAGFTLLAEQALPLEQLDAAALEKEIKNASEDVADAQDHDARHRAETKLAQLQELKAALRI